MKLASFILACVTCFGLQAELFFTPQMISKHLETYTDKENSAARERSRSRSEYLP